MQEVENITPRLNISSDVPKADTISSIAAVTSHDPISHVLKRPYLLWHGVIPSSSAINSVIYETAVSPTLISGNGATRISILASLFRQWCGDICLRFRCTKTLYVEGKLIMAFLPGYTLSNMQSVTVTDMLAQESSVIVNLVNDDCVEFSIPFISTDLWRNMDESTGVFSIRTYMPMVVSVTSAPSLPFSLEVFSRPGSRGVCMRYLASATSNPQGDDSTTESYDLFNTIDTTRGNYTYVYPPTTPTAPIQTAIVCPPATMQANLNSTYPCFGIPDVHWVTAGPVGAPPNYFGFTPGTNMKALRNFLAGERLIVPQSMAGTTQGVQFPSNTGRRAAHLYINTPTTTAITVTSVSTSGIALRSFAFEVSTPFDFNTGGITTTVTIILRDANLKHVLSGNAWISHYYSSGSGGYCRMHGTVLSQSFVDLTGTNSAISSTTAFRTVVLVDPEPAVLTNISDPPLLRVNDLFTKLRTEVSNQPPGFDGVWLYSVGNLDDARNMLNLWTDSSSRSHSEQLSFSLATTNAGRSERRDTQNSWFDTFTHVISDIVSAGHVIGDIITTVGNILSFVSILAADGYTTGNTPVFIDVTNPTSPVRLKVNLDKTALYNSALSNNEKVTGLRRIRELQSTNTTSLVLANLTRSTYRSRIIYTVNDEGFRRAHVVNTTSAVQAP